MKLLKIIVVILGILQCFSSYTKIYPDGTRANVFDACIILEKYYPWDISNEEILASHGIPGALTNDFLNIINEKEAIIASAHLMRYIQYLIKVNPKEYKKYKTEYLIKDWYIYVTIDTKFIVLIPREKYNDIPKTATGIDLEQIGLNEAFLIPIHPTEEKQEKQLVKRQIHKIALPINTKALAPITEIRSKIIEPMRKLIQQSTEKPKQKEVKLTFGNPILVGRIDINSLKNIFLNTKKVTKRLYLVGHGAYSQKTAQDIKEQFNVTLPTTKEIIPLTKNHRLIAEDNPLALQLNQTTFMETLLRLITAFMKLPLEQRIMLYEYLKILESGFQSKTQLELVYNHLFIQLLKYIKDKNEGSIAQLTPAQYVDMLDYFASIETSIIYITSCFISGKNSLAAQMANLKEQKIIAKKFEESINKWPFMLVSGSLPDAIATSYKIQINNFFQGFNTLIHTELKNFIDEIISNKILFKKNKLCHISDIKEFQEQLKKIASIINLEKIEECREIVNKICTIRKTNITEIDCITGKLLTPIYGQSRSLIQRNPAVITDILKILEYLYGGIITRFPSIKFPGVPFFRIYTQKTGKIENIETVFDNLKIIPITHHEIKLFKDKNKAIEILLAIPKPEEKTLIPTAKTTLIGLSMALVPIKAKGENFSGSNPKFSILSRISGEAHHFFEKIILEGLNNTKVPFTNIILTFLSIPQKPMKLFLVKNMELKNVEGVEAPAPYWMTKFKIKDGSTITLENFACKIGTLTTTVNRKRNEKIHERTIEAIYKYKSLYYYTTTKAKQVSTQTARFTMFINTNISTIKDIDAQKIIGKWIFETTPSKVALYEATEGTETEKQFIETIKRYDIPYLPYFPPYIVTPISPPPTSSTVTFEELESEEEEEEKRGGEYQIE